ncbi:sigma-54 dependent transcriptional regulator [Aquincola sp. MAHUQ-54]|uniref:Sigma-54 dependent transcriptional regulator n=1 Tax=Aquincola agrisoli TaxID=3119538 RepID=A0AAW9QA23_9BURK
MAAHLLALPEPPPAAAPQRAKALYCHDPRSLELLAHIERLARSDATVLVTGETGTGKELVARHIHRTSGRGGPFVAINCGAFSESLIDAELFGHEAGAYTGAAGARAGWFEAANGGTLFLDEIGDLPLMHQVKLLRVLQERQVVRLGARRPVPVDVRLIAATNVDLHAAVDARRFRADLFYRLSVAPVALPPLRERRGDILPLTQHFIGVYGPKLGLAHAVFSPAAREALLAHAWPGNIRELENAVHFALLVSRDGVLQLGDLQLTRRSRPPQPEPASPAAAPPDARQRLGALFDELLGEHTASLFQAVEETLVRRAYEACNNNQVHTAQRLGVTRNTLRTLLKRHGLLLDRLTSELHEQASAYRSDKTFVAAPAPGT